MSYTPTSAKARAAYDALKAESIGIPFYTNIGAPFARADLRELLIAYYCPIVCVGVINDVGWHKGCEHAADAALDGIESHGTAIFH